MIEALVPLEPAADAFELGADAVFEIETTFEIHCSHRETKRPGNG
jgi:hypothetical protein